MTRVELVPKDVLRSLISTGIFGTLNPEEVSNLARWLLPTTRVWIGSVDSDVVCGWGVVPPTLASDRAYIWTWWTDKVKDHEFVFVRQSQIIVRDLLKEFSALYGATAITDFPRASRWLRWLGASFGEEQHGFIPFLIEAKR